jgi:hypothetical protein
MWEMLDNSIARGERTMAGEEHWAQQIIQKELKKTVTINDDGSKPGMYDLRIGPLDAPEMAVECVGAVDQTFTETWNVGPARGPLELSTKGDWIITIADKARVKAIKQHVKPILERLEERGVKNMIVNYQLKVHDAALFQELESLGITDALCYRLPGSGKIHLTTQGQGGVVDQQGNSVPAWIGTFLRDPAQKDVLSKLEQSRATDCHVFVIVAFGGAPWSVESYLTGGLVHVPNQVPNLPPPVTGVWIVSSWSRGKGIRWDGITWQAFHTRGERIDD